MTDRPLASAQTTKGGESPSRSGAGDRFVAAGNTEGRAITMPLPEVTGWVRDVPVRAFRNVFAGIGQLLLAADRIRGEEQSEEQSSQDAGPAAVEQHDPLTTLAPQRPPDSTGNVRLLSPEELASRSRKNARSRANAEPARPAARRTAQRKPAAKRPAATPAAAKTPTTKTATT